MKVDACFCQNSYLIGILGNLVSYLKQREMKRTVYQGSFLRLGFLFQKGDRCVWFSPDGERRDEMLIPTLRSQVRWRRSKNVGGGTRDAVG